MFLTNNSPDLYALTSCIALRKSNLFLAQLTGISVIQIKIIDFTTFRLLLIFPEINFWKIYNHTPAYQLKLCMPMEHV